MQYYNTRRTENSYFWFECDTGRGQKGSDQGPFDTLDDCCANAERQRFSPIYNK